MSITGGLSWIDALEALTDFSFFALTFFVIYIVPWWRAVGPVLVVLLFVSAVVVGDSILIVKYVARKFWNLTSDYTESCRQALKHGCWTAEMFTAQMRDMREFGG